VADKSLAELKGVSQYFHSISEVTFLRLSEVDGLPNSHSESLKARCGWFTLETQ
jgi:hypothetical protein